MENLFFYRPGRSRPGRPSRYAALKVRGANPGDRVPRIRFRRRAGMLGALRARVHVSARMRVLVCLPRRCFSLERR